MVAGSKDPGAHAVHVSKCLMNLPITIAKFMEWVEENEDSGTERQNVLETLKELDGELDTTEAKKLYLNMVAGHTRRAFHTLMEMPVTIAKFMEWVEENEEDGKERKEVLGILTTLEDEFMELKVRHIWVSQKNDEMTQTRKRMRAARSGRIIPS